MAANARSVRELTQENARLRDELSKAETMVAVFRKERDGLFELISGLEEELKVARGETPGGGTGAPGGGTALGTLGAGGATGGGGGAVGIGLLDLAAARSPATSPQTSPRFEPLEDAPIELTRNSRRRPAPSPPRASQRTALPTDEAAEGSSPSPPTATTITTPSLSRGLMKGSQLLKSTFSRASKRSEATVQQPVEESAPSSVQLARGSIAPPSASTPETPPLSRGSRRDDSGSVPQMRRNDASSAVSPALSRSSNRSEVAVSSPELSRVSNRIEPEIRSIIQDTNVVTYQGKKVTLFIVEIVSKDGDTWKVARRYSQFHSLFVELSAKTSRSLSFPPKKFTLNMDEEKMKKRMQLLQRFLDQVSEMSNLTSTLEFARFIDPLDNPSVCTLTLQDVSHQGSMMQLVEMAFSQIERQKRFLMIVQAKLFYFRERNAIEPVGKIELDYCQADFEGALDDDMYGFSVKHLTMPRPIIFEGSEESCREWVSAIRHARLAIVGGVDLEEDAHPPDDQTASILSQLDDMAEAAGEPSDSESSSKGSAMLRRFAHGKSVRLSTFNTVPDTVSSLQGSLSFSDPDTAENVVLKDGEGDLKVISAATLAKLIEKLTQPDFCDIKYVRYFLLTYRAFLSPQELLAYLLARYHHVDLVESRKGFRAGGLLRNPVHDRICVVLQMWLDLNFNEFVQDADLTARLMSFVYTALEGNILMNDFAESIKDKVKTRILLTEDEVAAKQEAFLADAPRTLMPNQMGVGLNYLMDVDPLELARQIALLDHDLFCKIEPAVELVGQKWSKEKTRHLAPNVMAVIGRFNSTSSWVAGAVLQSAEARVRAALMTRLIAVGEALFQLRAYGPASAVVGGLLSPPVMRLKKTKELLSDDSKTSMTELEKLIAPDKNHKYYRGLLESVIADKAPCCPYLGLYLADLTFIEDGNPDFKGELVNFDKRVMLGKVLGEIITFQSKPYCLHKVPSLQYFLMCQRAADESHLYDLSLQREPRVPKN